MAAGHVAAKPAPLRARGQSAQKWRMTEHTYRAVVCEELGPPGRLQLRRLPRATLGPGIVRIAVKAAGINFPDVLMIQGLYQHRPRAAVEFLVTHGRGDDSGTDRVDARTALAPSGCRGGDPEVIGTLGETVSLLRVAEQCGSTRRYRHQVPRWGTRQLVLDPWIHRRMKMARHAGVDQSGATCLDDPAELLGHQSHTEQIHVKDRVDVGLLG